MALSIFVDALPYNEIQKNYQGKIEEMQLSELIPNIAYSSSLHWQLYCNAYPDQRGVMVDWVKQPEEKRSVRFWATVLSPLDNWNFGATLVRKVLDRFVYRSNTFANIPFRFRKEFSQKGAYLFWEEQTYRSQPIFDGYNVVSQDEGHKSFEATMELLETAIQRGDKDVFAVFGFADMLGHKCRRGDLYSERLKPYMERLIQVLEIYRVRNPKEQILIVSDHGMSTVKNKVDLGLEKRFGKQSLKRYIAYCDSAIMCIWTKDSKLRGDIAAYLSTCHQGHLLTGEDRERYGVTNSKFGDLIYILREGNVFTNNWFGKSMKKPSLDGVGMHGFWPERCAEDQMACIMLINGKEKLPDSCDYHQAHEIIRCVMKGQ